MTKSTFVYVTFIKTTPEQLWTALTVPDFTKQYWFGMRHETDWKVVETEPPKRLVLRWRNEFKPELKAEGYSLCTFELEATGGAVKLTITHALDRPDSKFIEAVSGGWPRILSNLKSLLETGSIALTT